MTAAADLLQSRRIKHLRIQKLGIPTDLDWTPSKVTKIVALRTFFQITYDAKGGFAKIITRFLISKKNGSVDFLMPESLNNLAVGEWATGKANMK